MYLLNQWFMHYYRMRHWSMSKMVKNLGLFRPGVKDPFNTGS